jgi:voltage-gated potassium channel
MMLVKDFLDGKYFGIFISLLIFYSLVTFSIETLPDLDESTLIFLKYSEVVVVAIFTLEYLCRVVVAENKLKFIFSFYGLIDLLAVIPFYLATSVDLRTLRLLRLLRLIRILKMVRYNKAINRFGRALAETKEELVIFTFAALIMLFLSSVGIYHFEHEAQPNSYRTIFDCLWWSVATLTTVGYGDIYPITVGGKIFTFCILLLGLGLIAVPASIMASSLAAIRRQEELKNGIQD